MSASEEPPIRKFPALPDGYRPWVEGDDAVPWPTIGEEALYGLPGDVVRAIAPYTESDHMGLLITALVCFGAAVGPGPHALADGSRHPARLFAVLVGPTASGRKGTAWSNVANVMEVADPSFMKQRVLSGFGSGESLIDHLTPPPTDDPEVDPVFHSSAIIKEAEFARVLRAAGREGATLSAIMRDGWDSGRLAARSRRQTSVTDDAHMTVLAHITPSELREGLRSTEIANGFGNRFLYALVRRSQLLPDAPPMPPAEIQRLGRALRARIKDSRSIGTMHRSPEASRLWSDLYMRWAADEPEGIVGELVARAAPQVLRLSVAYALTDGSPIIEVQHLRAAQAVWNYCRGSVEYQFGRAVGSSVADKLLAAIRAAGPGGLALTDQTNAFSRNTKAAALDAARAKLEAERLIFTTKDPEKTGGRPRRVSVAITAIGPGGSDSSSSSYPPHLGDEPGDEQVV